MLLNVIDISSAVSNMRNTANCPVTVIELVDERLSGGDGITSVSRTTTKRGGDSTASRMRSCSTIETSR